MANKIPATTSNGVGLKRGIVPALDLDDFDDILRLVEATTGVEGVVAYKIGLTSVLQQGLAESVRRIRAVSSLPILYDHQKAGLDIPSMGPKLAALAAQAGVDGLILFPLGGPSSLASFVGASLDSGLLPIVGAELPLADYTISGGGFVADDVLTRVIGLATGLGVNRFVVPANAPARVRVVAQQILSTGKDPALYLPGIGELGGTIQAAFEAAAGARTYAIIGRAIYAAANRAEAANRLAGEALERGQ